MFGTAKAALLYYRKMSKESRKYGLVIIPYYTCVENIWTKGGKLTVIWNVNIMKVSQKKKINK